MSKLPTRTIGRSRETLTKEFDQVGSELGSIGGTPSGPYISLLKIKAREGMKNVMMKNLNFRDEVVVWGGRVQRAERLVL